MNSEERGLEIKEWMYMFEDKRKGASFCDSVNETLGLI